MKSMYDCYELTNGVKVPCMGFGTYKAAEGDDIKILKMALEVGYRYFDTASFYENEACLARAVHEMGVKREELFLTSKAWKTQMGYEQVKQAFAESLEKLETDYLDLFLIHWPLPEVGYSDWQKLDIETWRALEELYREKKVRAIGVSNFLPHHLENLMEYSTVKPMVDQIEFHPGYTQEITLKYCREHNILVQAWSPLGKTRVLSYPLLQKLAEKYGVSAAQMCIRYAIQRGVVPLPKASSRERMEQNKDVFAFEISEEDMYRIGTMQPVGWSGEHPDFERVFFDKK